MARKLSVVTDAGPLSPPKKPARPASLKAAVELTERDLLVAMRAKVAAEIDSGVPAHALSGLMGRLREFDKEIRALDARDEQEGESGGEVADGTFDASAV